MKLFDCYENVIIEHNHFKERLRLLEMYREKLNQEMSNLTEIIETKKNNNSN